MLALKQKGFIYGTTLDMKRWVMNIDHDIKLLLAQPACVHCQVVSNM
jgi:hypothetical protein